MFNIENLRGIFAVSPGPFTGLFSLLSECSSGPLALGDRQPRNSKPQNIEQGTAEVRSEDTVGGVCPIDILSSLFDILRFWVA
jgi:hypothetical protein